MKCKMKEEYIFATMKYTVHVIQPKDQQSKQILFFCMVSYQAVIKYRVPGS